MAAGQRVIKTLRLDSNLDSYRDFFTTEQGQALYSRMHPGNASLIDDLGFAWRAAAYAAALPGQVTGQIPAFLDGLNRSPQFADSQLTTMERVLGILAQRLPTVTADPKLLRDLKKTVLDILGELASARTKHPLHIEQNDLWEQFLGTAEFQFYVVSSQRFCYLTTYAAYEAFLVGVARTKTGDDSIRSSDRNPSFATRLDQAIGESTSSKCWSAEPVKIAREIRNALMHERGCVTRQLEQYRSKLRLEGDEIQLWPSDNRRLFEDLLERVLVALDDDRWQQTEVKA
ncbi:hypothetical protein Pla111_13730 [Botrimarina hoheduenensis]|uniref:Uncharacterized protein n=1 Tax=Botrimarina hoheduenensis TaxID=2528000 RepID=A0A5C5WCB0_9BACT|nr:hypothetical protein Pla111_13730 [Botrimarina hoheduenensis]